MKASTHIVRNPFWSGVLVGPSESCFDVWLEMICNAKKLTALSGTT